MKVVKFNPQKVTAFNHLVIINLNELLDLWKRRSPYNASVAQIISDLNTQAFIGDIPKQCILVDYKEWGSVIFDFKKFYESDGLRVHYYQYNGVVVG